MVTFWAAVFVAPFVTHVAIATGRHPLLAAMFSALQIVALASVALRSGSRLLTAAGLMVAALLLAGLATRLLTTSAVRPNILATAGVCHAALYGCLLAVFAGSLRPGHIDLVTTIAARFNDAQTAKKRRYTRLVTKAWCAFFAAQLLGSAALLSFAPRDIWSLFVNVLDGPSVVLMFLAEFGLRRLRFRHEPHVSPLRIWRSYVGRDAGARLG